MKRKLLSMFIALAVMAASAVPVFALDENETPILSPFDSIKNSKLPVELSKVMARSSPDKMIGAQQGDDPLLVMYVALPDDMEPIERAFELNHLEPLLDRAGVSFRQVTQVGDVYYEETGGVFSSMDGISVVPQMPDGTDFIHYNGYEKYYEEIDHPYIHRGAVSLCATAEQIRKLCDDEDVICFSYGDESAIAFSTYYAHFTSDDALNILRAAVGVGDEKLDINTDGNLDSIDAFLALRESLSLETIYYHYRGGVIDTQADYGWKPRVYKAPEKKVTLQYYGVSYDNGNKLGTALSEIDEFVGSADRIVKARIDSVSFEPYSDDKSGLMKYIKKPEGEMYSDVFTVYSMTVLQDYKPFEPHDEADGGSFTIYGGKYGQFAVGHEKELSKAAGKDRLIPIITGQCPLSVGREYILLLSFDEASGRWTLTDYRHNGYEPKGRASGTDITGKNIIYACERLYK